MAKTKKIINIKFVAAFLIVALVASYIIYQMVLVSKSEIETQFALSETVYNTISAKGFVIRDESFITNKTKGTMVSFANNGERVARDDTVSVVFESSEDATSYLKISELEESIAHYKELSGQANLETLNVNSMNGKIDTELIEYLEACDSRNFGSAMVYADLFRDSLTSKQIATGSNLDFSKQVVALEKELNSLKKIDYKYTEVKSDTAGYFISGSDGYENVIKYSDVDSLTSDKIKAALKAKPENINENVVGRVVNSFNWYIACVVDTKDTINLSYNDNIYINLPYHGVERLPVKIHKIGDREGKKTMLVLSCDLMNDALAGIRLEDIEIITEEFTGYKIANSAIRTVDGKKGVYVVSGNLVGFRKINILYSTDNFTIVNNPDGSSDYIKLYDKVVTKGVELYDNKLI